jgi:hypothetical protein
MAFRLGRGFVQYRVEDTARAPAANCASVATVANRPRFENGSARKVLCKRFGLDFLDRAPSITAGNPYNAQFTTPKESKRLNRRSVPVRHKKRRGPSHFREGPIAGDGSAQPPSHARNIGKMAGKPPPFHHSQMLNSERQKNHCTYQGAQADQHQGRLWNVHGRQATTKTAKIDTLTGAGWPTASYSVGIDCATMIGLLVAGYRYNASSSSAAG